jgi:hypothetical protein
MITATSMMVFFACACLFWPTQGFLLNAPSPAVLSRAVADSSSRTLVFTSLSLEESSLSRSDQEDDEEEQKSNFEWTKQWYPLLPESYLMEKPEAVTVLDRQLVVWKTAQGQVSVMEDACPHRQAPLSTGRVNASTNTLACR